MTKKKGPSRLAAELTETAEGMHRVGLLDRAAYDKITLRHLGRKGTPKVARICLALERGTKRPTGAALALLNIIKRKGIEAIL